MRIFFLATLFFATCSFVKAATYTTINNGAWSIAANWSSGLIPPNTILVGDIVNINHTMTHNQNISIKGTLNINTSGSLNNSTKEIAFPTFGQGILNNSGTLKCKDLKVMPNGSECAFGALPRINNSGNLTAEMINVGNGSGCGSLFNSTSGIINTFGLHNDGYVCNSSTIFASTKFELHGGTMECCGNIITPLMEIRKDGTRPGTSTCQNYCTGSVNNGGVVPNFTGATTMAEATNPAGFSDADAVIMVPGTTWCSFYALPIELISFGLNENSNNEVELIWATASEKNNDYFTVERSKDGQVWEVVGQILGAGNSTEIIEYALVDEKPYIGLSYYRLRQTDYDGEDTYSNIISSNWETTEIGIVNIYPNPVENILTVNLIAHEGESILQVESINGMIVFEQIINSSGLNEIIWNMEGLSKGFYFVKYKDSQITTVKSILKN